MQFVTAFIDFVIHLDKHLTIMVSSYGAATYLILFTIVFAETGFIITPFLPGDSLLFAGGALAALGSLNIYLMLFVLAGAAILGDSVNYWVGRSVGQRIVNNPKIPFINQKHIDKTEAFYVKHGGKTIILARFVPIVRTFAPFVAGVGKMEYRRFFVFNIVGGVMWVFLFTIVGYFFGNLPAVKHNFTLVIFAIIGISLIPVVVKIVRGLFVTKNPN